MTSIHLTTSITATAVTLLNAVATVPSTLATITHVTSVPFTGSVLFSLSTPLSVVSELAAVPAMSLLDCLDAAATGPRLAGSVPRTSCAAVLASLRSVNHHG